MSLGLFALSGVAVSAIWYVTYEIRRRGLLARRARSPRETRTFASESEAKAFARSKLDEGLVVFAGTINPHLPRQLIPSQNIADWLVEQ
ncbi:MULTISPECIES: hypothetical protein [Bradyrhizobium]|uniref:hypothetical protein n=1 Tax=Bradyrhizobium TaxID=374 RepID=UPI000AF440C9|nr:hypothetical protein [Bradyrhizobium sp. USDA 4541]